MQPKPDSIKVMGLPAFIDERYYWRGGWVKLKEMFDEGKSNTEIAKAFTKPGAARPIRRQTVANWRTYYAPEQEVKS